MTRHHFIGFCLFFLGMAFLGLPAAYSFETGNLCKPENVDTHGLSMPVQGQVYEVPASIYAQLTRYEKLRARTCARLYGLRWRVVRGK